MPNKNLRSAIFLVSFVVTLLTIGVLTKHQIIRALFGGQPTMSYPSAGYMVMLMDDGQIGICGITAISNDTAVTAAHCIEDANAAYVGFGEYPGLANFSDYMYTVKKTKISTKYTRSKLMTEAAVGDVGIIQIEGVFNLQAPSTIGSPKEGCGYYLVAYGNDDNDEAFHRNGIDVCISNVNTSTFTLDFPEGSGFCPGDSGSAIFIQNTSTIVGLVSSYVPMPTCHESTYFLASRLDDNLALLSGIDTKISANIHPTTPTPTISHPIPTPRIEENINIEKKIRIVRISPTPSPTPIEKVSPRDKEKSTKKFLIFLMIILPTFSFAYAVVIVKTAPSREHYRHTNPRIHSV